MERTTATTIMTITSISRQTTVIAIIDARLEDSYRLQHPQQNYKERNITATTIIRVNHREKQQSCCAIAFLLSIRFYIKYTYYELMNKQVQVM